MIEIIYLALVYLIAVGLGNQILKCVGVSFGTREEQSLFGVGLGLGLLSYAVLAIGVLGALYAGSIYAVLVLAAIGSRREIRHAVVRLPGLLRSVRPRLHPRVLLLPIAVLALCVVMNSLGTLAPLSSSDALAYHFAAPKIYIDHHRIIETPWLYWHSYQPFTVQMLFTLGMLLRGPALGSLFHHGFGLLLAGGIAILCLRYFARATALLSAVIFYAAGITTWQATSGFIDLGLTFFAFLAVFAFIRWADTKQGHWLGLSGVFAGFAAGCKTTGGTVAVALAVLIILDLAVSRRVNALKALKRTAVFIGTALLVASPWYIKSLVQTGNPAFPFLYGIFGGENWSSEAAANVREALRVYGFGYGLKEYILAPWNITMRGEAFDYGQLVGPIHLSFVPLSLLYFRESRVIRTMLIFSAVVFSIWFCLSQQTRFLMPVLPLSSIVSAWVILKLMRSGRLLRYTVALVVGLFLLFGTALNLFYNAQFLPVVFGLEPEEEFLAKNAWFYEDTRYINENVPEESRLLVDLRGTYHLDRDFLTWGYVKIDEDPTTTLDELRRHGITHIFVARESRLRQLDGIRDNLTLIRVNHTTILGHRTLRRGAREYDTHLFEVKRAEGKATGA